MSDDDCEGGCNGSEDNTLVIIKSFSYFFPSSIQMGNLGHSHHAMAIDWQGHIVHGNTNDGLYQRPAFY